MVTRCTAFAMKSEEGRTRKSEEGRTRKSERVMGRSI
jgi:hypothetical protein